MPEPEKDAVTALMDHAEDLASDLARYRQPILHLFQGTDDDVRERLKILFYVAQAAWVRYDELEGVSAAPANEYRLLEGLGIIQARDGSVRLTRQGESLLTLLLFFQKDLHGAMSEGFSDIIDASLAGKMDADALARIQIGAALRLRDDLEQATATESLTELNQKAPERDTAAKHVRRALNTLRSSIGHELSAELEHVASALHGTHIRQEKTHLRVVRDNVRYPFGYTHQDLVLNWRRHSAESFASLITTKPGLFRSSARAPGKAHLDSGLRALFETTRSTPTEPDEVVLVMGEEGLPPLPAAWQILVNDLENVEDGTLLHEVASSPRSYFAAAYFAHRRDVPTKLRLPKLDLVVDPHHRIQKSPYLDAPRITIHWRRT